ncbi:MAG: hypothetical protein LBU04_00640 [Christensenellaceae bacterium]|nr:hypothetical protein [Christensenellaceae bacterium]
MVKHPALREVPKKPPSNAVGVRRREYHMNNLKLEMFLSPLLHFPGFLLNVLVK